MEVLKRLSHLNFSLRKSLRLRSLEKRVRDYEQVRTTPRAQWSYCLSISVNEVRVEPSVKTIVRLQIEVLKGAIGIFIEDSLGNITSTERLLSEGKHPVWIDLPEEAYRLVIRNTSELGVSRYLLTELLGLPKMSLDITRILKEDLRSILLSKDREWLDRLAKEKKYSVSRFNNSLSRIFMLFHLILKLFSKSPKQIPYTKA